MAPWNNVSLETYLNTRYRPDCDFVDGELQGRNNCLQPHSAAMAMLGGMLFPDAQSAGMRAALSCRVKIHETRYRVADICVYKPMPADTEAEVVPALCVEVVSVEQSVTDMTERVADYLMLGVADVWLWDPARRQAWVATEDGIKQELEVLSALSGKLQVSVARLVEDAEESWPAEGAAQRTAETLAMLATERERRPAGWFFSEENQEVFA